MTNYDFPTTELGMVLDAREYLLKNGGTPEELQRNAELIEKYQRTRSMPITGELTGPRQTVTKNDRPYTSTVPEAVLGAPDPTPGESFPTAFRMRTPDAPATQPQVGKIHVLLRDLRTRRPDVYDTASPWILDHIDTMTKATASGVITKLLGHLDGAPAVPVTPTRNVWAEWREAAGELAALGGRYGARFAVDTEPGSANTVAFWWISPRRNGGFTLRQVIGGGVGGMHASPVRMTLDAMLSVARKIKDAGPEEAMARFGRELGMCCRCGRDLTNDESRALGIGPECRKK